MEPADELECTRCGACCYRKRVVLEPEDEGKLTVDEAIALTRIDPTDDARIMRWERDGKCAALVAAGGSFLCSIYARRPRVCVEFERGSRGCLEWRERGAALGFPPRS